MSTNAIEQRLLELSRKWGEFVQDRRASVLVWRVPPEEVATVRAFFELQTDSPTAAEASEGYVGHPDLFLVFDGPFAATRYVEGVVERLAAEHAEAVDAGLAGSWGPSPRNDRELDSPWLRRNLERFAQAIGDDGLEGVVACVLVPDEVAENDRATWEELVVGFAGLSSKGSLRVVLLDSVEAPALDAVAELSGFVVDDVDLRLDDALRQTSREAGGSGPGVQFRNLWVEAAILAKQGWSDDFVRVSDWALRLADQQSWAQQSFAVRILRGNVLVGAASGAELNESKRREVAASACAEFEHAAALARGIDSGPGSEGALLHYQALMGEASVPLLLAVHAGIAGDTEEEAACYSDAAAKYAAAAELAPLPGGGPIDEGDEAAAEFEMQAARLHMEAARMNGFCLEKTIDEADDPAATWSAAWDALLAALAACQVIPQAKRAESTAPYVGVALLELTRNRGLLRRSPYRDRVDWVRQTMEELLGREDWEPDMQPVQE